MTPREVRERANAVRTAGKSLPEAFAAFEGTGVGWVAMMKAVCDAHGIGLVEARDQFDRLYVSLAPFELRNQEK